MEKNKKTCCDYDAKKYKKHNQIIICLSILLIVCSIYRRFISGFVNNPTINSIIFIIDIIAILALTLIFIFMIVKMIIWMYRNNKKDGYECTDDEINDSDKD